MGAEGKSRLAPKDTLGPLADASALHEPLTLSSAGESFVSAVEKMLRIRRAEERIADGVADRTIKCPCHLAIGQGRGRRGGDALRSTDRALARTDRMHTFLRWVAQCTGCSRSSRQNTGVSRGWVGRCTCFRANGSFGSVPIVGATISIAVGAALAAR